MLTKERKRSSGVMANVVEVGQENVSRLTESFAATPITEVAIDYIQENRSNPRKHISEASIAQMVNAIVQCDGLILEPLLIRSIPRSDAGHRYEVVCGDRRLLAAKRLEMQSVPVRVRDIDDDTAARFALWENLGREDLSAMDIAESVNDLRKIDNLTWDEIGEKLGFSRQWGWRQQKLAELPEPVKTMIREDKIKPTLALLIQSERETSEDIVAMAERVLNEKLSFRALESLLKCNNVVTPQVLSGNSQTPKRNNVVTWSPPRAIAKRKFARLNRATQDVVDGINSGTMTREYAASLRTVAERILQIAGEAGTAE